MYDWTGRQTNVCFHDGMGRDTLIFSEGRDGAYLFLDGTGRWFCQFRNRVQQMYLLLLQTERDGTVSANFHNGTERFRII